MVTELDLVLDDGEALHAYDSGAGDLAVVWHHGTPNIGAPPAPLADTARRLGIRWLSYDRPGYGGSPRRPGRDIASAAAYTRAVADARGVERFAVLGHSGGGSFALGTAALLPDRVRAAAGISSVAPYGADGLDWFAGMAPSGEASLRAALAGRAAMERHEASEPGGEPGFIPADEAALAGDWSWFLDVVRPAVAGGPAGLVDDQLSYVAPWRCDPAAIAVPVLLMHGADDRMVPAGHSRWLAARIPGAQLRVLPGDGHISVMRQAATTLKWLRERA
jgi:pimeloyl-ACP methyl ester carboxylesterase